MSYMRKAAESSQHASVKLICSERSPPNRAPGVEMSRALLACLVQFSFMHAGSGVLCGLEAFGFDLDACSVCRVWGGRGRGREVSYQILLGLDRMWVFLEAFLRHSSTCAKVSHSEIGSPASVSRKFLPICVRVGLMTVAETA